MFRRQLLISSLLLFSVAAKAQTGNISSPATPGAGDPSLVPLSNTNVSVRAPAVPTNTADQEGKIKFRTQTILIQVPIVVTDKSGNHIHGLTKQDFHVFENGKEQKVASFEEIVTTNTKLPVVAPKSGEFTNLALSDQQPRPVTVIALDTINTPFLDQYTGRRAVVKYLADNLDSGQILALMVMTSHGLKVVQGLTGDREQLVQLLKKASGEMPAMPGLDPDVQAKAAVGDIPELPTNIDRPFVAAAAFIAYGDTFTASFLQPKAIEETLNGFLEIAWSLSGIPGSKSLIWATGGFPFEISSPAQIASQGSFASLYQRTMQALDAAQISVYPVDVRGLVANSPMGSAVSVAGPTGAGIAQEIHERNWLLQSTLYSLDEFADMTGGKAFYNTNDLASSMKRAAEDSSSYYLAGYYLDTHNKNSGWRQLKVKVDKNGTEVRAREGFFVTNATMNPDVTRSSDLTYALSSPIEGTGVPLSMKWLGTSGEGANKKAEFLLHMPADGLSIESHNGQNHLNFDFAAVAYLTNGKTGKAINTVGKAINTIVPDGTRGIDMKNALELGPGKLCRPRGHTG